MALEKRTALDQIEIKPNGTLQIRLAKQIVDGDEVVTSEWHRTVVEPGVDPDAQMDLVDGHLKQMGYPPAEGRDRIKRIVKVEHTPQAIKAYRDAQRTSVDA